MNNNFNGHSENEDNAVKKRINVNWETELDMLHDFHPGEKHTIDSMTKKHTTGKDGKWKLPFKTCTFIV